MADSSSTAAALDLYARRLRAADPYRTMGRVAEVIGLVVESTGPEAEVGELCLIGDDRRERGAGRGRRLPRRPHAADAARRADGHPPRRPGGGAPAARCSRRSAKPLLGRVLDGLGSPIDGGEPLDAAGARRGRRSMPPPPSPLLRRRSTSALPLGVRALDALDPCGRGQRLGIFAGSGVGKSTLLGMIARNTDADVNVIGLVGERGREVREFVERDLGPEGLERSVVVVATSDEPALVRVEVRARRR